MSSKRIFSGKIFHLKSPEIDKILFCDNSDEDNLVLDEEDFTF